MPSLFVVIPPTGGASLLLHNVPPSILMFWASYEDGYIHEAMGLRQDQLFWVSLIKVMPWLIVSDGRYFTVLVFFLRALEECLQFSSKKLLHRAPSIKLAPPEKASSFPFTQCLHHLWMYPY